MEDVPDPEASSKTLSQDNSPPETFCGQNGAANGVGNETEMKKQNVLNMAGTDEMYACNTRICTCLQGCGKSGPPMQEPTGPSHLPPGALLRSDSLLMDANVEPTSDFCEPPVVETLDRLSLNNDSSFHTLACLSDRPSQAETRVKKRFMFATTRQQTHDDPPVDCFETDTEERVVAKEMKQDLAYLHCLTGDDIPLSTRLDSGADRSIARKNIVTRGYARLYRLATAVTFKGVLGEKVTTDEFTKLRVRCPWLGVGKTITIKFFLLDDKHVSGCRAYLGASDLKKIGYTLTRLAKTGVGENVDRFR